MWTTGLKRHHKTLSGGVHHGVGDLETTAIQAVQDLQSDTDPRFRIRRSPALSGRFNTREQRIEIDFRITDLQRKTIWRDLGADLSRDARFVQRKRFLQPFLKRCFPSIVGVFSVYLSARYFRKWAPITACIDRANRLLQQILMFSEKKMGHVGDSFDLFVIE